ncbi:hypothetical protein DFH09DRAFT_1338657 [Mycena vulgaris]|nr:hypothetical protein DFH09DRAFT_1338657 [Mycena vulgaris]
MSAYMCANSPPDSTIPWLMPAKRTYLACLNCRGRKIKCISADETKPCARCAAKSLVCEYMAVSEEQARSLSPTQGRRGSAWNAPPRSTPTPRPYTPQSPQRYIASTKASAPSYAPTYYQEYNPSQFGSPTPIYHGDRLPRQPQLPASGSRDLYNYEGNQPPLPLSPPLQFTASCGERRGGRSHTAHGPSHASSGFTSQQPRSSGHPSDYDRYFANFGLPPSYDPEIYRVFNLTAEVPEIPEIPETPDSFPYAKLRIAERMLYTETHNTTALKQTYVTISVPGYLWTSLPE